MVGLWRVCLETNEPGVVPENGKRETSLPKHNCLAGIPEKTEWPSHALSSVRFFHLEGSYRVWADLHERIFSYWKEEDGEDSSRLWVNDDVWKRENEERREGKSHPMLGWPSELDGVDILKREDCLRMKTLRVCERGREEDREKVNMDGTRKESLREKWREKRGMKRRKDRDEHGIWMKWRENELREGWTVREC